MNEPKGEIMNNTAELNKTIDIIRIENFEPGGGANS